MKQAIQVMTREILQILDGQEPSLYLFGSVTMDDFHLGWSDIDFLCLTKRPISPAQRECSLYNTSASSLWVGVTSNVL